MESVELQLLRRGALARRTAEHMCTSPTQFSFYALEEQRRRMRATTTTDQTQSLFPVTEKEGEQDM